MSKDYVPEMNSDSSHIIFNNMTPEMIAEKLFGEPAKEKSKYGFMHEDESGEIEYIFEILLVICLEGLEILCGDLSSYDMSKFSKESIGYLNPWFQSLGFNAKCSEFDHNQENKLINSNNYCNIYINSGIHSGNTVSYSSHGVAHVKKFLDKKGTATSLL